jgi:uncharacterized protein HemX
MDRFENNLRKALREPEARADLAGRILSRTGQPRRGRFRQPMRVAAAIVLAVALGAAGLQYERRRVERIASERARDQVVEAFRLAEQQLKPFRERLEAMKTLPISIPKKEEQK